MITLFLFLYQLTKSLLYYYFFLKNWTLSRTERPWHSNWFLLDSNQRLNSSLCCSSNVTFIEDHHLQKKFQTLTVSEKFQSQINFCHTMRIGTIPVLIANIFSTQKMASISNIAIITTAIGLLLWSRLELTELLIALDTLVFPCYLKPCTGYNNQENCRSLRSNDINRKSIHPFRYAGSCGCD